MEYYISTLAVYFLIDAIAVSGLNFQFGVGGILNFSFIMYQAAGAYITSVLALGPDSADGGFQRYIGGASLPFPLPLLCGALFGGLLSLIVGLVVLRKLRRDYQAIVLLVVSVIATTVIEGDTGLFNGSTGLALIPPPLKSMAHLSLQGFGYAYVGLAAAFFLLTYWVLCRVTESPWGRLVRASRDNEQAASALGKNVFRLRLTVFVIGGIVAALSGGLLVQFVGAYAPAGWLYPETFALFAAVIVGGKGNRRGVLFGTLVISIVIGQGSTYLPVIGPSPVFVASMQEVLVGVAIIACLWFRPVGIFPEPLRRTQLPFTRESGVIRWRGRQTREARGGGLA